MDWSGERQWNPLGVTAVHWAKGEGDEDVNQQWEAEGKGMNEGEGPRWRGRLLELEMNCVWKWGGAGRHISLGLHLTLLNVLEYQEGQLSIALSLGYFSKVHLEQGNLE